MLKFTGIERCARTLALNGSSSMKLSRLVKLLSINTFLAEGSSCEAAGKMKTASTRKNVKMTGSAHRLIRASFAKPTRSGTRGPGPTIRPQYDIPHLRDSGRALHRETLFGIPVCRTKGFQLHERPRQWTPSGPMQAVRRALVASTGEVTIRKMNVTGAIVYSRASLTLRAVRH
jgi:hypothetical protein